MKDLELESQACNYCMTVISKIFRLIVLISTPYLHDDDIAGSPLGNFDSAMKFEYYLYIGVFSYNV